MVFRILTATPGSHKDKIAGKIRTFVSELDIGERKAIVGVGFVEDELCDICPPDLYTIDPNKNQVAIILGRLPQEKIRELWTQAFDLAVKKATQHQDGNEPDLAVLVTSLSYYRKETFEFYCPANPKVLVEQQREGKLPTDGAILTLIDDIFDVYVRLTSDRHVFSIQELVDAELQSNKGTEAERYKKAIALVIQCLIRILEWRESEIQAAASLAAMLGWSSSVLAVKHPVETGVRILLGEASHKFGLGHSLPVYLSHPISVPRRENAKTGEWPPFVDEFDHFVNSVRECTKQDIHVVPVMPTAIDEYRFLKDGEKLLPRLAPRWPLPTREDGTREDLLYTACDGYDTYEEYETASFLTIFDPPLDSDGERISLATADERVLGMLMGDPEVSGMLRTLESVIRLQMANRDHLLVRQCPGFLLYRPTFESPPRFSGGVRAEIRDQHFHRKFDSAKEGFGRPMAYVHSANDLKQMFTSKDGENFLGGALHAITEAANKFSEDQFQTPSGQLNEGTVTEAMVGPGDLREQVRKIHGELFIPRGGSIGSVDPPSLAAIEDYLRTVLLETRVRSLCAGKPPEGWEWRYYVIGADGRCLFEETVLKDEGQPIILAAVIENLDVNDSQRMAAASLVCEHFANRYASA